MMLLISQACDRLRSLLQTIQVQQILIPALIGVLLMTSSVNLGQNSESLGAKVLDRIHQTDQADRPKTTGEWQQEARDVEGNPGKRFERIAKESGEAFKQFGSGYLEGAKETGKDLRQGTAQLGKDRL